MTSILVLSGPNLDQLGRRDAAIYGESRLAEHLARAERAAAAHGLELTHLQASSEGALVDAVHEAVGRAAAIVVNPGALTHYGWSLADALADFPGPVIEVHLSHPAAREPWRRTSVVAPVAAGSIAGFGGLSYELAVEAVARLLAGTRASSEGPRRDGVAK